MMTDLRCIAPCASATEEELLPERGLDILCVEDLLVLVMLLVL